MRPVFEKKRESTKLQKMVQIKPDENRVSNNEFVETAVSTLASQRSAATFLKLSSQQTHIMYSDPIFCKETIHVVVKITLALIRSTWIATTIPLIGIKCGTF